MKKIYMLFFSFSLMLAFVLVSLSGGAQASTIYGLTFTSGGTHEVIVGDTLTGGTGGATAVVASITLSSGSWVGGDGSGLFTLTDQTGAFQAENLNEGANSNVATIAGTSSSVVQTYESVSSEVGALVFTWTAEGGAGEVAPMASDIDIDGYILFATTNPGATAPTDNYDITLVGADGVDISGAQLSNRDTANSESCLMDIDSNAMPAGRFVDGAITFTLTGNSVTTALGVCKIYIMRYRLR